MASFSQMQKILLFTLAPSMIALRGAANAGGLVDQHRRIAGSGADCLLAGAKHDVDHRLAAGCNQHLTLGC